VSPKKAGKTYPIQTEGFPGTFVHPEGLLESARLQLFWKLGAVILAILLLFQVSYFEIDRMAQNVFLRPPLETLCHWLGCSLPPFHQVRDIEVIDRALYPATHSIDGYEFHLVMVNQAPHPQPYPLLKISLTALDGTLIAERVFKPGEYLQGSASAMMPSEKSVFVKLRFAAPQREVGGFQVTFGPPFH